MNRKKEHITKEAFEEKLQEMKREGKLSITYKENPTMILLNLPAGFKGEPEMHEEEDDLYTVLEGEAELVINQKSHTIKKGDYIHIPAKIEHQLRETTRGVSYLVVKLKNEDIQ